MAFLILGLILAAFTAFPLYCGFWPIGVITVLVLNAIAIGFVYWSDDQGEEGLSTMLSAFVLMLVMWAGMGLAGIISIFI